MEGIDRRRKRHPGAYITRAEGNSLAGLSGNAQTVYFALRLCRNAHSGRTQPIGHGLIIQTTGLSNDKVKRALKELREGGYIEGKAAYADGRRRVVYTFPKARDEWA